MSIKKRITCGSLFSSVLQVYLLAVIEPYVSSPEPRPMVLVLIGNEVVDESRHSGFKGVGILMRAIPVQHYRQALSN